MESLKSYKIKIVTINEAPILADVARQSFFESHGHSGPLEDVNNYADQKLSEAALSMELQNKKNNYYIIYHNEEPAGYSNIVLDAAHPDIAEENITKLDRIYLLQKFYGRNLGKELFHFNLELSKRHGQKGMWLYVWKKNERGFRFYTRQGFKPIGSFDFKLSENHSNPNHLMWLEYGISQYTSL